MFVSNDIETNLILKLNWLLSILINLQCTMYNLLMYNVHCTLCINRLYIVHYTSYNVQYINVQRTMYNLLMYNVYQHNTYTFFNKTWFV